MLTADQHLGIRSPMAIFMMAGVVLFSPCSLKAEELPDPLLGFPAAHPEKPSLSVQLRCVRVPGALAPSLIRDLRDVDPRGRRQGEQRLAELLTCETAHVIGWSCLAAHEGEISKSEEDTSARLATSYLPGTSHLYRHDTQGKVRRVPNTFRGINSEALPNELDTVTLGLGLSVVIIHSFEDKVSLSFSARLRRLESVDSLLITQEEISGSSTQRATVEQPRFSSCEVASTLTLTFGESQLVGCFRAPEGQDQWDLFMMDAELSSAK